jgi:hypothetical protein
MKLKFAAGPTTFFNWRFRYSQDGNITLSKFHLIQLNACFTNYLNREERDLFLPDSPNTATADIIVTMPLPRDWGAHLRRLGNQYVFASELKLGDVVTFVSEAKCNNTVAAQRQLTLYLCSAQHQRRALGFDDGRIFGATVVRNTLTMYCSTWEDQKVVRTLVLSCLRVL